MDTAYLIITCSLQGASTAHLAMHVSIPTHVVQRIAIRQLRPSQRLELARIRMQFQLGGDDLFHSSNLTRVHAFVKYDICVKSLMVFIPIPFRGWDSCRFW
jgi:hypothetical protein